FRPIRKAWLREPPPPRYRGFEQSNTSILYERQFFLKLYRRLEPGTNPEIELGRFLTEEARYRHSPRILAALTLEEGRRQYSVGVLESYVENEGDAWSYTLDYLKRFGEEVLAMGDGPPPVKPLPGLF